METGERAALEIDLDHTPAPEPQSWILTVTAIGVLSVLRRSRRSARPSRLG